MLIQWMCFHQLLRLYTFQWTKARRIHSQPFAIPKLYFGSARVLKLRLNPMPATLAKASVPQSFHVNETTHDGVPACWLGK